MTDCVEISPIVSEITKAKKALKVKPKCPHGKQKHSCKNCWGSSLCGHECPNAGKLKSRCKNCGGSALCGNGCANAGKYKSHCKNCGGSALCGDECPNAGKQKSICKNCGGSALCGKECPRAGKQKSDCKNCGGSSLCGHACPNAGKRKSRCKNCGGSDLCGDECPNAGKLKSYCKNCGGSALCGDECPNAGKQKVYCKSCSGSALCGEDCPNTGKLKVFCVVHGGSGLCAGCHFTIVHRVGSMCRTCAPVARRQARCREARMAAKLDDWARDDLIPRYTLWNKQNPLADPAQCGRYRVDFVFQHAIGVVLLEYDEQMHADRVLRCELVRQAEVALGYGGLPVHWIRFNPDAFKVDGVTRVTKREEREKELLKQMQRALSYADYEHPIKVTYICYHQTQPGDHVENELVQHHRFKTVEAYNAWVETIS